MGLITSPEISCVLRGALSRQFDCNSPQVLAARPDTRAATLVTRKYCEAEAFGQVSTQAASDAILLTIELKGGRKTLRMANGARADIDYRPDDIGLRSLSEDYEAYLSSPFDSLFVYLPQASLDALTDDLGMRPIGGLQCPPGATDPVCASLARALLPALERPSHTSSLFVDHVVTALETHLIQRYGGLQAPAHTSGGLARWQQKRALEFMTSRGMDNISINDIAAECRLSRSYFIKAFKQSLGETPHRWLLAYRVERAKELLLGGDTAIADIATQCGFVDQSHLTRVFTNSVGQPPGLWRRQYRLM